MIRRFIAWYNLRFRGLYYTKHDIPVRYIKQPVCSLFRRVLYWKITRYGKKLGYMFSRKRRGVVINPYKRLQKRVRAKRVRLLGGVA